MRVSYSGDQHVGDFDPYDGWVWGCLLMARRGTTGYLAPALLALFGFVAGALGAAGYKRSEASERWRAMRLEHEGVKGQSTRTKLIFDDPKLPLQGVEVLRTPEGVAERAHVAVRGGGGS